MWTASSNMYCIPSCADSLTDVIPGMQVRLMKHQIIGVAWCARFGLEICILVYRFLRMLHREVESKDRGGILAYANIAFTHNS